MMRVKSEMKSESSPEESSPEDDEVGHITSESDPKEMSEELTRVRDGQSPSLTKVRGEARETKFERSRQASAEVKAIISLRLRDTQEGYLNTKLSIRERDQGKDNTMRSLSQLSTSRGTREQTVTK
jgi:hypothetical protein